MNSDTSKDFSRPPRTIVPCFDGTNGQYNDMNTNGPTSGLSSRIGTCFAPGVVSPLFTSLASLVDEAVAWYLDAHVMAGYQFLMANYRIGDRFAYSVFLVEHTLLARWLGCEQGNLCSQGWRPRRLVDALKVGLLPKDNLQQINFAYKAYTRTDKEGAELAAGFEKTFSQDVKVEFVGVWDTVQNTGVLNRILPFMNTNSAIKVFRHALSLEEHRSRFWPDLYHWPVKDDAANEIVDSESDLTLF